MKPSEDYGRLSNVLEEAEMAFWAVVANNYPEAKHGDFSPDAAEEIGGAMETAVVRWLEWNADPQVVEDRDAEIMCHKIDIEYYVKPTDAQYASDLEHIGYCISQNIAEGELNRTIAGAAGHDLDAETIGRWYIDK